MVRLRLTCILVLAAGLFLPTYADAQASRSGLTFTLGTITVPVENPDAAYDPVNSRYLVVTGKGIIQGQLATAGGALITTFRVNLGS